MKKLNCRTGDLAIVMNSQLLQNLGQIVEVMGRHSNKPFKLNGRGHIWQVRVVSGRATLRYCHLVDGRIEQLAAGPAPDRCLRPVSGLADGGEAQEDLGNLFNPALSFHAAIATEVEPAARRLGVTLRPIELRSPDDIDAAFATLAREPVDALLIFSQGFLFQHGARVAKLAIEQRLPAIIPFREVVRDGVLMSYSWDIIDDVRRLPYFVDRVLKGAKPAELPVEQPTRFYLTINQKTAKALGLTIPQNMLLRADEVIE